MAAELKRYIRVLGTDASGKTALCNALESLNNHLVGFGSTPAYVHRWLRTYGIGRSSDITSNQVETREQIFMRANEHEALAIADILDSRSVIAVRGRADTVLTHAALRGHPMPHYFPTLFPVGMRPDLLIVLVASPHEIEARLDARGQRKTGANCMEFHVRCRDLYEDVAGIAQKHLPVLLYDTSRIHNTAGAIAKNVQLALENIN
ncbi:MAG TPA: hypothetical protein VMS08_01815 [Candidatus Saccharimonadia bacterium]|nr:hypothetical protein [Candidatus Saccharimonadia bacterium]